MALKAVGAPVIVFWDFQTCPPPSTSGALLQIIRHLRLALEGFGPIKEIKIFAVSSSITSGFREELQYGLFNLNEAPTATMVERLLFTHFISLGLNYPAPTTIVLISSNPNFVLPLNVFNMHQYSIVLVPSFESNVDEMLLKVAHKVFSWSSIAGKGSPSQLVLPSHTSSLESQAVPRAPPIHIGSPADVLPSWSNIPVELWNIIVSKLPLYAKQRLSICSKKFLSRIRPLLHARLPKVYRISRTGRLYGSFKLVDPAQCPYNSNVLSNITSLEVQELNWSPFRFSLKASKFTALRTLKMHSVDSSWKDLFRHNIPCLPNLEALDGIYHEDGWENVPKLTCLQYRNCSCTHPKEWHNLPTSLRILSLQGLESLASLSHLSNLESLDIDALFNNIHPTQLLWSLETYFPRLASFSVHNWNLRYQDWQYDGFSLTLPLTCLRFDAVQLLPYIPRFQQGFMSPVTSVTSLTVLPTFRHLTISNFDAVEYPSSLTCMAEEWPPFIASMNLVSLSIPSYFLFSQLQSLTGLKSLTFYDVKYWKSLPGKEHLIEILSALTSLEELSLQSQENRWGVREKFGDVAIDVVGLLDAILRLPRLQVLKFNSETYVPGELANLPRERFWKEKDEREKEKEREEREESESEVNNKEEGEEREDNDDEGEEEGEGEVETPAKKQKS